MAQYNLILNKEQFALADQVLEESFTQRIVKEWQQKEQEYIKQCFNFIIGTPNPSPEQYNDCEAIPAPNRPYQFMLLYKGNLFGVLERTVQVTIEYGIEVTIEFKPVNPPNNVQNNRDQTKETRFPILLPSCK